MFFGHLGVGFAAKRASPAVSLGVLLGASAALDVMSGLGMLAGVADDTGMAWTHGLLLSAVWSLSAFVVAFLVTRQGRASAVIALVVMSHWVLDFISHPMGMGRPLPPDLPLLLEGSRKVGLGLYNSVAAALITDFGLLAGGAALYLTGTRADDRRGAWRFWLLMAFVFALAGTAALPPTLQWVPCLAELLLVPLGVWVEGHRSARTGRGRRR